MEAAGVPASTYQDLIALVQATAAGTEAPGLGDPPSQRWTAAVAFEHSAAMSDANCRRTPHDVVLGLVGRQLPAFEAEHSGELAVIPDQWAAIVADASDFPESKIR